MLLYTLFQQPINLSDFYTYCIIYMYIYFRGMSWLTYKNIIIW